MFTMYILPNISRRKGNQAIKFDQLIEYNMRNIFTVYPRRGLQKNIKTTQQPFTCSKLKIETLEKV